MSKQNYSLKNGEVFSDFEVMTPIGRGGMGEVYLAIDKKLQRKVALKVISAQHKTNPRALEIFFKEARILAQVNHPNVVSIFTLEEDGERPFIAMELVTGIELSKMLKNFTLPQREALEIATGLAKGLHCLQQNGIVHRDLKPQNIIIQPNLSPKILDFGIAESFNTEAVEFRQSRLVGTPLWTAPEIIFGEQASIESDIWSLGAIFYNIICGRNPLQNEFGEIIEDFDAFSSISIPIYVKQNIDLQFVMLIEKMLSLKPQNRPSNLGSLVSQLKYLLKSTSQQPLPSSVLFRALDNYRKAKKFLNPKVTNIYLLKKSLLEATLIELRIGKHKKSNTGLESMFAEPEELEHISLSLTSLTAAKHKFANTIQTEDAITLAQPQNIATPSRAQFLTKAVTYTFAMACLVFLGKSVSKSNWFKFLKTKNKVFSPVKSNAQLQLNKPTQSVRRVTSQFSEFDIGMNLPMTAELRLGTSESTYRLNTNSNGVPDFNFFPRLYWHPFIGANSYHIQVSLDKKFSKIVAQTTTAKTALIWSPAKPGKFFWRFKAKLNSGNDTRYSGVGTLWVKVPPVPLDSIKTQVTDKSILLEWPASLFTEAYQVSIVNIKEGHTLLLKSTLSPRLKFGRPSPGEYKVSIVSITLNGQPISDRSETLLIVNPDLGAPRLPSSSK